MYFYIFINFNVCNELEVYLYLLLLNLSIIHLKAYSLFKVNVVNLKKNNLSINFNSYLLLLQKKFFYFTLIVKFENKFVF